MNRKFHAATRAALIGMGAAALIGIGTAGCGTSGAKIGVREMTARADADGVQRVSVNVHSFYFDPNRINVEAGKPVELTLHFKPIFTPHNMTCEAPEAGIQIDKSVGIVSFSHTKKVRFTPTKAGEYDFYCGVDSHMKKGMTGKIVVH